MTDVRKVVQPTRDHEPADPTLCPEQHKQAALETYAEALKDKNGAKGNRVSREHMEAGVPAHGAPESVGRGTRDP